MNAETLLMRKIEVALCERGCWVMRTNSGLYYDAQGNRVRVGFVGLSDLIGCNAKGEIFFIEVKGTNTRVRPEQQKFIDVMRSRGRRAGLAYSVEEAIQIAVNE